MQDIDFEALATLLLQRASTRPGRWVVGLAGAPGSGKSTTVERLKDWLNARHQGLADILPMDGYHFDDAVLGPRGDQPRKGAPHTFDRDGFAFMLARLKADDGRDIAVPVFDRDLEIARAGGRVIAGTCRIILVEGNYLLLDAEGWRDLKPQFDMSVFVTAPEQCLAERLLARWQGYGMSPQAIAQKLEGNDFPNMRLILQHSQPADYRLNTAG